MPLYLRESVSPPELDSFRLPEADENGVVSTCIPFNLDISSLGLGETLEVEMKIQGTGKSENRLVEKHLTDSRVQIIIPVSDPVLDDVGPPEWLDLYHASGISIQRKSWNEVKSGIVLRRETEETNDLELNILVVLNKLELKLDEFHLGQSRENSVGSGRQNLAMQYVSFTEDWQADCYGGSDEDLMMNVFIGKGAYEIMQDGSCFILNKYTVTTQLPGLSRRKLELMKL